jgi:hypothetical protein
VKEQVVGTAEEVETNQDRRKDQQAETTAENTNAARLYLVVGCQAHEKIDACEVRWEK